MELSAKDILGLQNPFKELGNSDALNENINTITTMTFDEQRKLAVGIIMNCPQNELKQFRGVINGINPHNPNENNFSAFLSSAHEIKSRLLSILDPRNNNPHVALLEIEPGIFSNYMDLVTNTISQNENPFVLNLALKTPQKMQSKLSEKISLLFPIPQYSISTELQQAFNFKRKLEATLLSEQPELFFNDDRDLIDTCRKFSSLMEAIIKDKEEGIGIKLSRLEHHQRASINRQIEGMIVSAPEQYNPLRKIRAIMSINAIDSSCGSSSEIQPPPATPRHRKGPSLFSAHPSQSNSMSVDSHGVDNSETEDRGIYNFCCNLFRC